MLRMLSMAVLLCLVGTSILRADQPIVLFDGSDMDHWEFRPGGWEIEDGTLTCRMEQVKQKNGQVRTRGMGYIWTRTEYGDFELSLSYKLSDAANSGVFYRTDPDNPVQGGFELQLLDNEGFQKVKGARDGKNLNGAFYDCMAPLADPGKPAGQWNHLRLICDGPQIQAFINGVKVIDVNVNDWHTPGKNPDGSSNKFKTALKDLPRVGRIGFQNHGQVVWFKDVTVRPR